ncbi:MAG TPA: STAS domain-containing protein [Terriglobales bacterium]|nr:STAS domain-containing protein [Terriglobales bacterium]
MQLKTSTRSLGQVMIVDCSGRLVFGEETTLLRDTVKELLVGSKQVVLNLAHVTYIDSSGVGTLVGLYASAKAAGAAVKLAALSARVRDVLVITKLGTIFEVHGSAEEAAGSFSGGAG